MFYSTDLQLLNCYCRLFFYLLYFKLYRCICIVIILDGQFEMCSPNVYCYNWSTWSMTRKIASKLKTVALTVNFQLNQRGIAVLKCKSNREL